MKDFMVPAIEVVRFEQKDIVTSSVPCECVSCDICDYGNHCACNDFGTAGSNG